MNNKFVHPIDAFELLNLLKSASVDLFLFDPPFYKIVKEDWDNQWKNKKEFVDWFLELIKKMEPLLSPNGSIIFFGGLGKHKEHAFWEVCIAIEEQTNLFYRNCITWKKRRAYGKTHDYLFTRQEIAWYSKSPERTKIIFNIPYSKDKREFKRSNAKYVPKSNMKRVTNVWTDITEIFYPERTAQKPLELMERLVFTHSNPGDLIIDPFVGWGTTGITAVKHGRNFIGSEIIKEDAEDANTEISKEAKKAKIKPYKS
jgi:site-specific DNA-methyltransferase (adenine-specific)